MLSKSTHIESFGFVGKHKRVDGRPYKYSNMGNKRK